MTKDKYCCKACGKQDKLYDGYCKSHAQQIQEFGFIIHDAQTVEPNEIQLHNDYAELIIKDIKTEYEQARIKIDIEDIDTISDYTWKKTVENVISKDINGNTIMLKQVILDNFEDNIKSLNGDLYDYRKENIEVVTKVKKQKRQPIVSKKNKNKIIIELVGKTDTQVTGSAMLISIPTKDEKYKKILVEFGSNQTNRDLYTEYILNKEIVDSVPCSELEYAFILHEHGDHIFNMPALIPQGFKGRVISTSVNKELMLPMLLDAAFIMSKNVKSINSKKHNIEPLYTESDVYLLMNRTDCYKTHEIHKLTDEISFQFVNAGHILGSCQLILYIKTPTGQIKKIHVTSDLGSGYNKQPFVAEKDIVTSSNISFFEATYNDLNRGFKSKKEVDKERKQFKEYIKKELLNKRNILIGVFAQARQQSMQVFLYEAFKDDETFNYPIYIDGVLGHSMSNAYLSVLEGEEKDYWREVMSWKNFHYVNSFENSQSVALNKSEPKITISSGGMYSNGRVLNHLKTHVEDRNSNIVICGYQAEGCIGHELQRKEAKTVKIEGLEYNKKAKIHQLKTWSSHIQADENINYMSQLHSQCLVLHHSDENKYKFRDIVEEELRKRNNTTKVICADEKNNIFYV